jgi:hypothetical protein
MMQVLKSWFHVPAVLTQSLSEMANRPSFGHVLTELPTTNRGNVASNGTVKANRDRIL